MNHKLIFLTRTMFFAFIIISLISCKNNSDSDENKCNSSSEGYKLGYEVGRKSIWSSPETHKRECNNGNGMIGKVPPCWDEGFRDGYNSK